MVQVHPCDRGAAVSVDGLRRFLLWPRQLVASFMSVVAGVTERDTKPWRNLCTINVTGVLRQTRRGWKAAVRAIFKRAAFLLDKTKGPPV